PDNRALPSQSKQPVRNGDLARDVAKAVRKSKLNDYQIDICVHNGVITLDGFVASSDQQTAAERAAASVGKSLRVNNRLGVASQRPGTTVGRAQQNESRLSTVLRKGMTVDEVHSALETIKMDGCWGGAGWTKFWCTS